MATSQLTVRHTGQVVFTDAASPLARLQTGRSRRRRRRGVTRRRRGVTLGVGSLDSCLVLRNVQIRIICIIGVLQLQIYALCGSSIYSRLTLTYGLF